MIDLNNRVQRVIVASICLGQFLALLYITYC